MRAVNLVPAELRGAGGPSRSGGAVHALLAALGFVLVLVTVTTLLGRHVADREARAAVLEAEAAEAEARAAQVARFKALAVETAGRVQSVREVAVGRVDWSDPLSDITRSVGAEVRFTALSATTSPAAAGGAVSNPLRAARPGPAVSITGCARDHTAVARLIARFRAMDDVTRVSLSSSTRPDAQGAPATTGAPGTGGEGPSCARFAARPADFAIVIFLEPAAAATATAAVTPTAAGATP